MRKMSKKDQADRDRLNQIADRLRAGERYEAIVAEIDKVTGTEMAERDEASEAVYEARRNAGEVPMQGVKK
jgi:hypothetical protein